MPHSERKCMVFDTVRTKAQGKQMEYTKREQKRECELNVPRWVSLEGENGIASDDGKP